MPLSSSPPSFLGAVSIILVSTMYQYLGLAIPGFSGT